MLARYMLQELLSLDKYLFGGMTVNKLSVIWVTITNISVKRDDS